MESFLKVGGFKMIIGLCEAELGDNVPGERRPCPVKWKYAAGLSIVFDFRTQLLQFRLDHGLKVRNLPLREVRSHGTAETTMIFM